MMAPHPETGQLWYFIDMCLPFGASISCARFQAFSDALKHITEVKLARLLGYPLAITNYLDDFLFIALTLQMCNRSMEVFLEVCQKIGCPISQDKTEWATQLIVFLGILLNGFDLLLAIPQDKKNRAIHLLRWACSKRKVMVQFVQKLTGTLNFLNKAMVPGRAFTRGMYQKLTLKDKKGNMLKQHHHIWLNNQFVQDCRMWIRFLELADVEPRLLCRPFIDFSLTDTTQILAFYSDASRNGKLGFGAIMGDRWIVAQWPAGFVEDCQPSIEFLELFALTIAVLSWDDDVKLQNTRVTVFCDNEEVVHMVNTASSCNQCMKLIRILVLNGLKNNRRLFIRHILTKLNILADSLSRLNMTRFWKYAPKSVNRTPDQLCANLWPVNKIWNQEFNYL